MISTLDLIEHIQRLKNGKFKTTNTGKFKGKLNEKRNKTCFIYQENILEVLKEREQEVTLGNIHSAILDLVKRVNDALL